MTEEEHDVFVQQKEEQIVYCKDCHWAEANYYKGEIYYTCKCKDGLNRDVPDTGFCYMGFEQDK